MKAKKIRVSRHGTRRVCMLCIVLSAMLCSCTVTRTVRVEQSQEKQIQSVEFNENGSFTLQYK